VLCDDLKPAQELAATLGVSDTIETMGEQEREILQAYGVELYTHVPSVYGDCQLAFNKNMDVEIHDSLEEYFISTAKKIKLLCVEDTRAVIVFFPDKKRLMEFHKSKQGKEIAVKNILLEGDDPSDRDHSTRKAASCWQCTLTTASFG